MPEDKIEKWKMLAVIISSLLGAYATIMSTLIQTTGAKQTSVEALAKQNQEMISQINNRILPEMDKKTKEQIEYFVILRERLAKLEGRLDGTSINRFHPSVGPSDNRRLPADSSAASAKHSEKPKIEKELGLLPLSKIQISQSPQLQDLLDAAGD